MTEPSRKKIKTRSATDYFLIGRSAEHISGNKLPLLSQVLQYVLNLKETTPINTPIKNHLSGAVDKVLLIWSKAGIKTITRINAIKRLQNEYDTWLQLCKNKTRQSDPGRKREMFVSTLSKLWDIGAHDAIQYIRKNNMLSAKKKEEDIAFYEDQRSARKSVISGEDLLLRKSVKRRQEKSDRLITKPTTIGQSSSDEADIEFLQHSSSAASTLSSGTEYEESEKPGPSSKKSFVTLNVPRNLINSMEITEVLDRFKISDNAATMLIASFIKASQGNLDDFCLSRSSTYRARIASRLQISTEIFNQIIDAPQDFLALHWDGKLTKDCYGNKYEALSVLVSGVSKYKQGKLLGVQKLERATGKAQAEASFDLLEVWNLKDEVKALVFDTTASNTGCNQGAAKTLEKLLDHKLFYHACRHHIYELIIGAVYTCLFGDSTAPEDPHFNAFQASWPKIEKSQNYCLLNFSSDWLREKAKEVICELQQIIQRESKTKEVFIRGDYKQCAENTLALLGAAPSNFFHHKPGATSSARWMGKVLYCQKMFLWADQMSYDSDFLEKLHRINAFIALFYVPAWLKCSIGLDAPINDLIFLQNMIRYKTEDPAVADAAFAKLSAHQWYLTEETVVFSFFSHHPLLTNEVKESMALRLLSVSPPDEFRRGIPVFKRNIDEQSKLHDFIGTETWFIFDALNLEKDWLYDSPEVWISNESFKKGQSFVANIKVVNDAAERGVKLHSDYAAILTENEEQRASILQVVEKHRSQFADFKKSTLAHPST